MQTFLSHSIQFFQPWSRCRCSWAKPPPRSKTRKRDRFNHQATSNLDLVSLARLLVRTELNCDSPDLPRGAEPVFRSTDEEFNGIFKFMKD